MKNYLSLFAATALFLSFASVGSAQFGACCGGHGGVCGCKNGGVVCCDGFAGSSCGCEEDESLMVVPTATPAGASVAATIKPPPSKVENEIKVATATAKSPKTKVASLPEQIRKFLPNSELTPGDLRSVNKSEICRAGYIPSLGRASQEAKDQAYKNYNISDRKGYEIDHLVSKGVGGSSDPLNLWPQQLKGEWNMRRKDQLENHVRKLMCAGKINLDTIQKELRTNWIAAYKKYLGDPAKSKVSKLAAKPKKLVSKKTTTKK